MACWGCSTSRTCNLLRIRSIFVVRYAEVLDTADFGIHPHFGGHAVVGHPRATGPDRMGILGALHGMVDLGRRPGISRVWLRPHSHATANGSQPLADSLTVGRILAATARSPSVGRTSCGPSPPADAGRWHVVLPVDGGVHGPVRFRRCTPAQQVSA